MLLRANLAVSFAKVISMEFRGENTKKATHTLRRVASEDQRSGSR